MQLWMQMGQCQEKEKQFQSRGLRRLSRPHHFRSPSSTDTNYLAFTATAYIFRELFCGRNVLTTTQHKKSAVNVLIVRIFILEK